MLLPSSSFGKCFTFGKYSCPPSMGNVKSSTLSFTHIIRSSHLTKRLQDITLVNIIRTEDYSKHRDYTLIFHWTSYRV